MKPKLLMISLFLLLGLPCMSQSFLRPLGVGIGTSGITFRSNSESPLNFITRVGIGSGYSLESYDLSLLNTSAITMAPLRDENWRLYFGLGFNFFYRQNFRSDDDIYNVNLEFLSPVGIEVFPFKDFRQLGITVETQFGFSRSAVLGLNRYGVLEFTYYFDAKK
jgi:hypothetical protein